MQRKIRNWENEGENTENTDNIENENTENTANIENAANSRSWWDVAHIDWYALSQWYLRP